MRLGTKIILVAISVLIAWLLFSKAFDAFKDKYLYRFIANRFHVYAEKRWGADLYIGHVQGSIFRDISLKNIAADGMKVLPAGFKVKADSLDIVYPPFGFLFGRYDAKFENLRLIYDDVVVPIDAYQREGLAVISIKKNSINLGKLSGILPNGSSLSGAISAEGEIMLKQLKPHLLNLSLNSKDFQLSSNPYRKIKGAFAIEVSGKAGRPQITGNVKVAEADIKGGFSFLSVLGDLKLCDVFTRGSSMDINLAGRNITASNRYMTADLSASLKLKKEPEGKPYFRGSLMIDGGTFKLYENQFRTTGGNISFGQMSNKPLFDITGETNVGYRRIYAKIEGGEDMRVTLSSQPELPYSEIASLLIFGKDIKDLSAEEKDRLTRADFNDNLITSLFSF